MWTNPGKGSVAVTGSCFCCPAASGYRLRREDGGSCKHSRAQPLLPDHESGMCSSVCAHLAAAPSHTSLREQCQPQDTPSAGAHLAEEKLISVHSIIPRALGCLPIVNTALEHRSRVLGQQTRDWDRRKGKDMRETQKQES